jgi:hypothetical protein
MSDYSMSPIAFPQFVEESSMGLRYVMQDSDAILVHRHWPKDLPTGIAYM